MKNYSINRLRLAALILMLIATVFGLSFTAGANSPQAAADNSFFSTQRLLIGGVSEQFTLMGGPTYIVNTTSDTVVAAACANGTSGCSLRGAITAANTDSDSNTIQFAIPGTDTGCSGGVCTINLTQSLPNISNGLAISGPGADKLTVRRNSVPFYSVFTVNANVSVTFAGLTISNGSTPGSGGGIRNAGGTVNVNNCTISGNQTPMGGAGGGIFNSGLMNIFGSTISDNQAPNGSAGGIRNQQGTMNIINSTISGNFGHSGGAITQDGTLNITNSTITGNNAVNLGGGVHNSGLNNVANVKNSIIAGNTAPQGPDAFGNFASAGFNLIGKTDESTGFTAPTDQTGTIGSPLNARLGPLQNNGGTTRTISPQAGSPAIDKGTSNGLTGNLTTDQRGTGFPRTFDNTAITNAVGGNGTDIGAIELGAKTPFDFDGDGKTDVSIFRPSNGQWWISRSSDNSHFALTFGVSTDKLVPADYTGDGKSDVAIYRPSGGEWFILRSEDFTFFAFPFGLSIDRPVPADYDGDGRADPAVFRPSTGTWYINDSSTGGTTVQNFGTSGDRLVPADYDGDGKSDLAIYRLTSNSEWWVKRSSDGIVFVVTTSPRFPINLCPGDYTGDGKADFAFVSGAGDAWSYIRSEDLSINTTFFGAFSDIPVPGDYDGDGRFDIASFRPSTNTWRVLRSSDGALFQQTFGATGDLPLPYSFVR